MLNKFIILLVIIIISIYLYQMSNGLYEKFSEYNRQEDYKFYNVSEKTLKQCGIIKSNNKIKNWEQNDNIYNTIIPKLLQILNSNEYKQNPRYYYSQLYFARKGKTDIKDIDIIIDLINQYMECVFFK